MRALTSCLVVLVISFQAFAADSAAPLVVHEWGTFTSLQDESGRTIGGLNSSVESLPPFVHHLRSGLIINGGALEDLYSKSVPRAHPDVTMRLETPVIYFYPKDKSPITLDVTATLRGGV